MTGKVKGIVMLPEGNVPPDGVLKMAQMLARKGNEKGSRDYLLGGESDGMAYGVVEIRYEGGPLRAR